VIYIKMEMSDHEKSIFEISTRFVVCRQLEENINKWTLDLEDMEKVFLNQATQVYPSVSVFRLRC
jgi:hypothetical protein